MSFTNPKDSGHEGHGSSLLIFDDSNDQVRGFKNLMVRIFTKLKCLLVNAGPKVKASDNSFLLVSLKKMNPNFYLKLN